MRARWSPRFRVFVITGSWELSNLRRLFPVMLVLILVLSGCASGESPSTPEVPVTEPTGTLTVQKAENTRPATVQTQPPAAASPEPAAWEIKEYPVPAGSHPHDVAPAADGSVWYTAQRSGELGRLDPKTGQTHHIPLGNGSAPHGVIIG